MSKMITRGSVAGTELSGAQLKAALTGIVDALTTAGLHSGARSTINADTTLTVDQAGLLLVDCTRGNVALTLPSSGDTTDDAVFLICRLDNTTNTLSYVRGGSDTVEGSSSAVTIPARGIIGLQMPADGTDWKVFSRSGGTQAGARASIGLGAGANIASAATLNLSGRTGDIIRITGTTGPITSVTGLSNGDKALLIADSTPTFSVSGVLSHVCVAEDMILFAQDNAGTQHAFVLKRFTASTSQSGEVELATDAEFVTGSSGSLVPPVSSIRAGQIVQNTLEATTSGTVKSKTGIPSWAHRIIVKYDGLSTDGASPPIVQLGVSNTAVATGYTGAVDQSGTSAAMPTNGIQLIRGWSNATVVGGTLVFERFSTDSNKWTAFGVAGTTNAAANAVTQGQVTLSAQPDSVFLTTVSGAGNLDAGSWSVSWE